MEHGVETHQLFGAFRGSDDHSLGPDEICQNLIAIKLGQEIGLESVAQTAQRMGIRSEIERFPSTAIGAVEVIPLQMAEAYSTFANQGTKVRPFPCS